MQNIPTKKSTLYINNGMALFIGNLKDNARHKHHSIQLVISDNSFHIETGDDCVESKSYFINSNITHKISSINGSIMLLLLEPESYYGELIAHVLQSPHQHLYFSTELLNAINKALTADDFCIHNIIEVIFRTLNIPLDLKSTEDKRIIKVIDFISHLNNKVVTPSKLAKVVHLSESRLQHLFKQKKGLSIKRYLLWKKMIDGVHAVISGNNFTFAAHQAGFADSAHMSRTFKAMFGLNLSSIFKDSSSVQVIIEKES